MKITVEDIKGWVMDVIVFLDGEIQPYSCGADDKEGYVLRYISKDGKHIEPLATEKVYGKLQFSYIHDTTRDDEGNIVFGKKFDKIQDLINYIKEK